MPQSGFRPVTLVGGHQSYMGWALKWLVNRHYSSVFPNTWTQCIKLTLKLHHFFWDKAVFCIVSLIAINCKTFFRPSQIIELIKPVLYVI